MPELPEVETTVRGLQKKVLGRTFVDAWTDWPKAIKKPFAAFKKEIIGKKIKKVRRRAKLILFDLSDDKTLLVHQKLTGHLLLWDDKNKDRLLADKMNSYIHLLLTLDNGQKLALSDLRKFAKVELWDTKDLIGELKKLGPEPLEKDFTFEKFKEVLKSKKGKIKQVLMDQNVIAGIGNIYSDEILFDAKIHPFRSASGLSLKELKSVYIAISKILNKSIELKGESISDWRTLEGKKGFFDDYRKVYRRERCSRCKTLIERKKIGSRSTYFCPKCQKC